MNNLNPRPPGFHQTLGSPFVYRTRAAAQGAGIRLQNQKRIWRFKAEERPTGGWLLRVFNTHEDKTGHLHLYMKSQEFHQCGNIGQLNLVQTILRKQSENPKYSPRVRFALFAAAQRVTSALAWAKEEKDA